MSFQPFDPARIYNLIETFFQRGESNKTLDVGPPYLLRPAEEDSDSGILDMTPEFIRHGQKEFSELSIRRGSLLYLKTASDDEFNNILISAGITHLNGADLIELASNVMRIAESGARIIVVIRRVFSRQDEDDRAVDGIPIGRLISLFAGFGGKLLFHEETQEVTQDNFFVFEKIDLKSKSGIDAIQEIIVKDQKTATYKLALIRALAQMAKFETNLATYRRYNDQECVCVPLKQIAFYWFKFYFPLLTSGRKIKQITNKKLAFEDIMLNAFQQHDLTEIISLYEDGKNRQEVDKVLKKIRQTIYDGPMKHIGDSHYEVFRLYTPENAEQLRESEMGMMLLPMNIWHDLILFGHWIEDSVLMEWARLTERINKNESFPEYLKILSTPVVDERTTGLIRDIFKADNYIECAYSGRKIKISDYEVDHVIPFGHWGNNDLWNLLPVDGKLNGRKKNRVPSPELIRKRKDCIIHYWGRYKKEHGQKFNYQVEKSLGNVSDANWENAVFLSFYERISRIVNRKTIDVWDYSV